MKTHRSYPLTFGGALLGVICSALGPPITRECSAAGNGFPAPEILQTGDLIWPKKPNVIVPYNSAPGAADNQEAARWEHEKNDYVAKLRQKPELSPEEKQRYTALRDMNYQEFIAQYLEDQPLGSARPYSNAFDAVGHVAIIEVVHGAPTVIEAMIGFGVRRLTYKQWLDGRNGEVFWVGRLKGVSNDKKADVVKTADSYIGKPYDFWNFNLSDTAGFYCSKLAWFSILSGTGFAPDDNANPVRVFWYSPKQLMHSPHIEMIVNPGNYGAPIHRP